MKAEPPLLLGCLATALIGFTMVHPLYGGLILAPLIYFGVKAKKKHEAELRQQGFQKRGSAHWRWINPDEPEDRC